MAIQRGKIAAVLGSVDQMPGLERQMFYSIRVPNLIKIGKSYKVTHLAVHGLKYVGGWSLLEITSINVPHNRLY